VVEVAEEFVEAVVGRHMLVEVAQMVLAVLPGHVAVGLEQLGDGDVFGGKAFLGAGQADLQQAGAETALPGDEGGPTRRAGLFAISVGEEHALLGDAIDVGRLVAHHTLVVGADIPVADVVAPDHQDVGFLVLRVGDPGDQQRGSQSQRPIHQSLH
jgi:hypothetical protein